MHSLDARDERDGTGGRHDGIHGQGQQSARHVHVNHAKCLAMLVVGRLDREPGDQPITNGQRRGTQEPRREHGGDPIDIGRRGELIEPCPHYFSYCHSNVMRNAVVAANGASVHVNTQSAARKYSAPVGLTPDIALSVAPAPKISNGIASASTTSDKSKLPRRNPTVSPP